MGDSKFDVEDLKGKVFDLTQKMDVDAMGSNFFDCFIDVSFKDLCWTFYFVFECQLCKTLFSGSGYRRYQDCPSCKEEDALLKVKDCLVSPSRFDNLKKIPVDLAERELDLSKDIRSAIYDRACQDLDLFLGADKIEFRYDEFNEAVDTDLYIWKNGKKIVLVTDFHGLFFRGDWGSMVLFKDLWYGQSQRSVGILGFVIRDGEIKKCSVIPAISWRDIDKIIKVAGFQEFVPGIMRQLKKERRISSFLDIKEKFLSLILNKLKIRDKNKKN